MSSQAVLPPSVVKVLLDRERLLLTGCLLKGLVHNISGGLQLMRLPLDMLELKLAQGPVASAEVGAKLEILQQGLAKVGTEMDLLSARASQQMDLQPRLLRLPALAAEQMAFWRGDMFFKHEAQVTQEMPHAAKRTRAAYADVALAFNALLANALESLQASGKRGLWASYAERDDALRLEVADEGPGPDPEMAEVMFDPFTGDKTPPHGGLGLFLAAQALAPWGGRLEWAAQPRTCFSLVLPASEP